MSVTSTLNSQISEALSRRTPNERRLLTGLALVALAVMPVKAAGMKNDAALKNEEVRAELARARQVAGRSQGGVRGQVATGREQVRSWSWRAENAEVGKVFVQNKVAEMAEEAGLADIDVKLADKTQQTGDVQLVPLELTADFSWKGLSGFLSAMESAGKGFVLDGVQKPDSDKPRLKLNLRAPVALAPTAPAGGTT